MCQNKHLNHRHGKGHWIKRGRRKSEEKKGIGENRKKRKTNRDQPPTNFGLEEE